MYNGSQIHPASLSSSLPSFSDFLQAIPIPPTWQVRDVPVHRGVYWWMQLSDLHFSDLAPARWLDFHSHLIPSLSVLRPAAIVVSGDLTREWADLQWQAVHLPFLLASRFVPHLLVDIAGNADSF